MITIRDIAKLAGVSKTTVARALNGDGYVKDETRRRVEKAVKELKYTPNYFARGMRTRKSATIGLFVPDYANPFYAEVFIGIEGVTRKLGYMNLVCHTDEKPEVEFFYVRELLKRQIDGIVFCTYNQSNEGRKVLQEISLQIPVVMMDPVFPDIGLSSVVSDGYNGTKDAVEYLVKKGSTRIAYIKGPRIHAVTTERFLGYRDAMGDSGMPLDSDLVIETEDFRMASGGRAVSDLLKRKREFDAIIAATDVLAIGALKELISRGIPVPEKVRVIGFDNIPLSSLVEPALTTVAQPIQEMGMTAANLLIRQIENPDSPREKIVLNCELIARDSA